MTHWSDNDLSGSEREVIRKAKPKPVPVLTKHQMREVNYGSPDIASMLAHYKITCGRLLLLRTMRAIDEAAKTLGYEVAEMRERFDNSGRRPK